MNVLIYNDEGVSGKCLNATLSSLRSLLTPYYAVSTITAKQVISEPWQRTAALFVMPGGRDLPYCAKLNGAGNQRIKEFVRRGGKYLGLCAGAYYASRKVEFELDTSLAIEGSRELCFFDNISRGCAFSGFQYNSEQGARAALLKTDHGLIKCYYNGGGIFVDASTTKDTSIIAEYVEDPVSGQAAVIQCKLGEGMAVLSAIHPEVGPGSFLESQPRQVVLDQLRKYETERSVFFCSLLSRLDLKTSTVEASKLSVLHLITSTNTRHDELFMLLHSLAQGGNIYGGTDTFRFVEDSEHNVNNDAILICLDKKHPETPMFNTSRYLESLSSDFGASFFYGETITSSQSLLDKNFALQRTLPSGFFILGSRQTQGRGRGSNAWVSPIGVLSFSMLLHSKASQIIFMQYLVSLTVVEAIKALYPIDVQIKWPNDIYVASERGVEINGKRYAKVGGILITTTHWEGKYILVIGIGLNVSNDGPSTSLKRIHDAVSMEELLAKFMSIFEHNFEVFEQQGFEPFMDRYHTSWLHSKQRITIETTGQSGIITGLHPAHGTLLVKLDNGQQANLSSDGNSFDMLRNLILVKR